MAKKHILVVDDDSYVREATEELLSRKGYVVDTADAAESALVRLEEGDYDLVLSDIRMPGMNGLELLDAARSRAPDAQVVMMTAFGTIEDAVEAMKKGALDYIQKGADPGEIELVVEKALKYQETERENRRLRFELQDRYGIENMVIKARSMERVRDLIQTVAASRATVLVTGESGTGKELVARALHYNSPRRDNPFVRLNCAALPQELVESELFGHEKGAFTGAIKQTRGRFEMADGGTLLLDEISEISSSLQAKLLRVLQEREFERIGSSLTIRVDVRIIATTNRDLHKEIESGRFREDLYYRLNVIEIGLPPLRQRKEEIPALVDSFLHRFSDENRKNIAGVSSEALDLLVRYDWPGNIRELENYTERAVVVARGPELQVGDFPGELSSGRPSTAVEQGPRVGTTIQEMERRLILKTLEACNGNRTEAAAVLDISTRTLRNKLHEYGAMDAFKERGRSILTGGEPPDPGSG